jgi:hypothetical protein
LGSWGCARRIGDGDINLVGLIKRLPDIPISLEIPADRLRDSRIDAKLRAQMAFEETRALLERVLVSATGKAVRAGASASKGGA